MPGLFMFISWKMRKKVPDDLDVPKASGICGWIKNMSDVISKIRASGIIRNTVPKHGWMDEL
jgi:hypothetical protein